MIDEGLLLMVATVLLMVSLSLAPPFSLLREDLCVAWWLVPGALSITILIWAVTAEVQAPRGETVMQRLPDGTTRIVQHRPAMSHWGVKLNPRVFTQYRSVEVEAQP